MPEKGTGGHELTKDPFPFGTMTWAPVRVIESVVILTTLKLILYLVFNASAAQFLIQPGTGVHTSGVSMSSLI